MMGGTQAGFDVLIEVQYDRLMADIVNIASACGIGYLHTLTSPKKWDSADFYML